MNKLKNSELEVYTMNQLMKEGSKKIHGKAIVKRDDIYTFCYTSGTTGTPKAALISNGNMLATMKGFEMM
jgi:long-chain acyl-CoA synthetase